MSIITADHLIGNTPLFRSTLHAAQERASRERCIITIGIQPSDVAREWIGFGAISSDAAHPLAPVPAQPGRSHQVRCRYCLHTALSTPLPLLLLSSPFPSPLAGFPAAARLTAYPLLRFEEKPSEARAREMIAAAGWFWNAGMFVFRVSTLEMALEVSERGLFSLPSISPPSWSSVSFHAVVGKRATGEGERTMRGL